jgi:tetratricopeptide (TPR) repeat protein
MPSLPPHPDSTLSPRRGRGISVIGTVGCKGSWLSRWNGVWVKLFNLLIRWPYPTDFKKFVAQGDAARDMGNWGQAEEMYQMALQGDPSAAPIWVQYGHALKEQDKLAPALEAYRTALRLDGDNADTHLQLGHALKSAGDQSAAAEAYYQALQIDPALHHAAIELKALGWSEEDLPTAFDGQHELALLLSAVQESGAAQYSLLISNPVFASIGMRLAPAEREVSLDHRLTIVPGPLGVKTRADSTIFNELDPDYANEDIPLTRHMTHTWHRYGMHNRFDLNSDSNRLAYIVWYYQSRRSDVGAPPEKLVTSLNLPAQAHGPLTRFLFGIWQSEYRDQDEFDVQREEGYLNFLTEVVGRRRSTKHVPEELLPNGLLTAIHQPAIGDAPHCLSKAAYSIWHRSETYRTKYNNIDDWCARQAFNFELMVHELGVNPDHLISHDVMNFWRDPISPKFPDLSRFAAVLAHISRRFSGKASRDLL